MELLQNLSFDNTQIAFSPKSNNDLRKTYWIFSMMNKPWLMQMGTPFLTGALKMRLPVKGMIKHTLFEQFCGGENIDDCKKSIGGLVKYGIGTILDYSVEGEKTDEAFDKTEKEVIATIEYAAKNPKEIPFSVFKVTGVGAFAVLEKMQQAISISPEVDAAYQRCLQRVDNICKKAHELGVRLLIDGEETWIQDTIDQIAYAMIRKYNKETAIVYNTYQMYTTDRLGKLKAAYQDAVQHQVFLGAKLVRGAYMEKERERAQKKGYADPIQPNKEACDGDYNAGLKFCLDNKQRIFLCAGTHNEYSSYYLAALMEKHCLKPGDARVFFAQLYGMSDNISFNLADAGYNVAKYVPYGPVASVMPYLIRRASENSSVSGQSSREFLLIEKEMSRRKLL